MTTYRIVCTTLKYPTQHRHIVEVGTGTNPDSADEKWAVDAVRRAILNGDRFYTQDAFGVRASVERYTCTGCNYQTIRSTADSSPSNNLDNLRQCSWKN